MDSTEIELGSLNRNVEGLSSKIDDLGKNLSPDEKNSIINGLHESDSSLNDIYDFLQNNISEEMTEIVSTLENKSSDFLNELKDIKNSLNGKSGKSGNGEEKIEKAQKGGKMETFINQVDRKYLAGAIVLHSDLEIVNKNLESIIKSLSGNSSAKTPKEQKEAKLKSNSSAPKKGGLGEIASDMSELASGILSFGKNAAGIIIGLSTYSYAISTLTKLNKKAEKLKDSKALYAATSSLNDIFKGLNETAKIASRGGRLYRLASKGIIAAGPFLKTAMDVVSSIKINMKTALENSLKVSLISTTLQELNKAAKVSAKSIAIFLVGALGNATGTLYVKSLNLLINNFGKIKAGKSLLKKVNEIKITIEQLRETAIVSSKTMPYFIIGAISNLLGSVYVLTENLLISTINKISQKDITRSLNNVINIKLINKNLLIAAIEAAVALPFYTIGIASNLIGFLFIKTFGILLNAVVGLNKTLETARLVSFKMIITAIELVTVSGLMSAAAPLFTIGIAGNVLASLFVLSFGLVGFAMTPLRGMLGTMLITSAGMVYVGLSLLTVCATMSMIAMFPFASILIALGMITLITSSTGLLGGLMYVISPTLTWVSIGSILMLVAFGSIYLALKALNKCTEFDLDGLQKVMETLKTVILEFTKMILWFALGIVVSLVASIFGVLFALACGSLLLGFMALQKLGQIPQQDLILGLDSIKYVSKELGKSIGWILLGMVSSILLSVFGLTFMIGVGTIYLSFKMLKAMGTEFTEDDIKNGFDRIKYLTGKNGINSISLVELGKAALKGTALAAFGATMLMASLAFMGTFASLKRINELVTSEKEVSNAFDKIEQVMKRASEVKLGNKKQFKELRKAANEVRRTISYFTSIAKNLKKINTEMAEIDVDECIGKIIEITTKFCNFSVGENSKGKKQKIVVDKKIQKTAKQIRDITKIYAKRILPNLETIQSFDINKVSAAIDAIYGITSQFVKIEISKKELKALDKLKDFSKDLGKTAKNFGSVADNLAKLTSDPDMAENGAKAIKTLINMAKEIADPVKDSKKVVSGLSDYFENFKAALAPMGDMVDSINKLASIKELDDTAILSGVDKVMAVISKIQTKIFEGNKRVSDLRKDAKGANAFADSTAAIADVTTFMSTIIGNIGNLQSFTISDGEMKLLMNNVSRVIDIIAAISSIITSRITTQWNKKKKGAKSLKETFTPSLVDYINLDDSKTLKDEVFKKLKNSSEEITSSLEVINSTMSSIGAIKESPTLGLDYVRQTIIKFDELAALGYSSMKLTNLQMKFQQIKLIGEDMKNMLSSWQGVTSEAILNLVSPIESLKSISEKISQIEAPSGGYGRNGLGGLINSLNRFSEIDYSKLANENVTRAAKNVSILISSLSETKSANANGIEKMMNSFSILSDKNVSKNLDKLVEVNDKIQSKWGDTVINQVTFDAVVNSLTLLSSIIKDKAMNVRVVNEMAGEEENKPFQIKKLGGN